MSRFILGLAAVLLIIGAFIFFRYQYLEPQEQINIDVQPQNSNLNSIINDIPGDGINLNDLNQPLLPEAKLKSININEETDNYLIEAFYPEFVYLSNDNQKSANQAAYDLVQSLINDFKASAKEVEPLPDFDLGSSQHLGYDEYYLSDTLISLNFSNEIYMSGAAHGFVAFEPFNYDLNKNKEIKLNDFFLADKDHLQKLSELAIAKFDKELGPDGWFPEGAEPKAENFQDFVFTDKELIILFEPYAVAAYAVGPQELEIPYDDISEYLDWQSGPLQYFKQ